MKFSTDRSSTARRVAWQSATIRSWVSATCGAVYFVAYGYAEKTPVILSKPLSRSYASNPRSEPYMPVSIGR